MLDLQVRIDGDKVVIEGLKKFARELPRAVDRGLDRVAQGVHREAYAWLSGAGAKVKTTGTVVGGKIKGRRDTAQAIPSGGFPVPVRTGNLRGHLDWLRPGASKTGPAGTFTAGDHEVVVYDSAEYAHVIHEGLGSSAKFGARPYLKDGFERFNQGDKIVRTLEEEIRKEIK